MLGSYAACAYRLVRVVGSVQI